MAILLKESYLPPLFTKDLFFKLFDVSVYVKKKPQDNVTNRVKKKEKNETNKRTVNTEYRIL